MPLAAVAAIGAVAVWSTNALAAGTALDELSLSAVLALQFGGATLVLLIARAMAGRVRGGSPSRRARDAAGLEPRAVAVAVVGLTAAIGLQYLAFATAPLVAANAIAYSWPLIVAAWSARRAAGTGLRGALLAALGFVGVVLIFAQQDGGSADGAMPALGYAAALGSATAMAYYSLAVGDVRTDTASLLPIATSTGFGLSLAAALVEGAGAGGVVPVALALYTGVGPMAAGYGLWTLAMSQPDGVDVAPVAFLTPLASTLLLLASGQTLSPLGLVGCAMIVLCAGGVLARMPSAAPPSVTSGAARAGGPSAPCPPSAPEGSSS